MHERTSSTFPLPLSLMLNGKDSSRPVLGSCTVRNAWCGRFGDESSLVVRTIFRVSVAPRETSCDSGDFGENLKVVSNLNNVQ